jgi:hypothetical protein
MIAVDARHAGVTARTNARTTRVISAVVRAMPLFGCQYPAALVLGYGIQGTPGLPGTASALQISSARRLIFRLS